MSYIAQRMVPESALRRLARELPAATELVPSLLLAGVGAALARRWWTGMQELSVPLARGVLDLPLVDYLYQLPGLAVVGLLFIRAVALAGHRTLATQHLSEMAARWAWAWAATSLVWLAMTASKLTGVPVTELGTREDLFAVLGRSAQATTQITTLWVALVIALFGNRLNSTLESRALTVLAGVALLPVVASVPGAGHDSTTGHLGGDLHWLATAALAVQLLAAVVWFGGLVAVVVHLRVVPFHLHRALLQFSHAASLCVALIGSAALVQDALTLPTLAALGTTTSGQLVIGKAVALALLVTVGYRHRRRTADAGATGRLLPLLRLVGGELILLGAVVAITMVITPVG